jgi:hypothetical protein
MRSSWKILPTKTDPRVPVGVFCAAWLLGTVALIIGLNGEPGEIPAIGIFALACVMWRAAYKLRGRKRQPGNAIGFLALAIWLLNLLAALAFDYHHYVTDLFFWASTATLLLLILATALFGPPRRITDP